MFNHINLNMHTFSNKTDIKLIPCIQKAILTKNYYIKGTNSVHLIHSDEACFPEGLQQLYHHMTGSVPF